MRGKDSNEMIVILNEWMNKRSVAVQIIFLYCRLVSSPPNSSAVPILSSSSRLWIAAIIFSLSWWLEFVCDNILHHPISNSSPRRLGLGFQVDRVKWRVDYSVIKVLSSAVLACSSLPLSLFLSLSFSLSISLSCFLSLEGCQHYRCFSSFFKPHTHTKLYNTGPVLLSLSL